MPRLSTESEVELLDFYSQIFQREKLHRDWTVRKRRSGRTFSSSNKLDGWPSEVRQTQGHDPERRPPHWTILPATQTAATYPGRNEPIHILKNCAAASWGCMTFGAPSMWLTHGTDWCTGAQLVSTAPRRLHQELRAPEEKEAERSVHVINPCAVVICIFIFTCFVDDVWRWKSLVRMRDWKYCKMDGCTLYMIKCPTMMCLAI